jgi:protein-disulfide isomerase
MPASMSRWLLVLIVFLLSCVDRRPTRTGGGAPKRPGSTGEAEVVTPTSDLVPVYAEDPSIGPRNAKVTIVMWADFQCPFCARVSATMHQLSERYGDRVRIVWKDLPLEFHKYAREAAVIAHVAFITHGNEGFWQMHQRIYENQLAINPQNLLAWASEIGLDAGTINLYRKEADAAIDRSIAEGKRLGLQGTPSFMIDGRPATGMQSLEYFSNIVDEHLKKAKELAAMGVPAEDLYATLVRTYFQEPAPAEEVKDEPLDTTVWNVAIGTAPIRGPKTALVTLVMFADFQCVFCKRLTDTFVALEKAYPGKLRFVWKDLPLSFHNRAMAAAIAAREVRKQKGDDGFWKFHNAVYAGQAKLEDDDLVAYAATIPGVDTKKVLDAITTKKHSADIDKDLEQSEWLKIQGTPNTFVNGRVISGAQPLEKWKKLLDEELVKAEARVKAGVAPDKVYEASIKGGKEGGPAKLTIPADAPWRGGANAKVVIHVFADFQCPFCRRLSRDVPNTPDTGTLEKLEKKYGDKIKIVWRDFPLSFHDRARAAANFAREAKKQKGMATFWKVHNDLFDTQTSGLGDDKLEELAKRYGIDWPKAKAAIATGAYNALIDEDMKIGGAEGVTGTPASFVNGRAVVGAQAEDAFEKVIDRELKK